MLDHPGRAAPPEGPLTQGIEVCISENQPASPPAQGLHRAEGRFLGSFSVPYWKCPPASNRTSRPANPRVHRSLMRSASWVLGLCPHPQPLRNSRQVHCFQHNSHLGEKHLSSSALSWHNPSLEHLDHSGSQESHCSWVGRGLVILGSGHSSSDGPLAEVEASSLMLVNEEPCTPSVQQHSMRGGRPYQKQVLVPGRVRCSLSRVEGGNATDLQVTAVDSLDSRAGPERIALNCSGHKSGVQMMPTMKLAPWLDLGRLHGL